MTKASEKQATKAAETYSRPRSTLGQAAPPGSRPVPEAPEVTPDRAVLTITNSSDRPMMPTNLFRPVGERVADHGLPSSFSVPALSLKPRQSADRPLPLKLQRRSANETRSHVHNENLLLPKATSSLRQSLAQTTAPFNLPEPDQSHPMSTPRREPMSTLLSPPPLKQVCAHMERRDVFPERILFPFF